MVRMLISEYLRDAGYQVVEAGSADEALECLRSSHAVSLVFSDVRMPGSLNGLELAQRVGLLYPGLPVLLASGHLFGNEAGDALLFSKPYVLDEVAAKIRSLIGDSETGDPAPARA